MTRTTLWSIRGGSSAPATTIPRKDCSWKEILSYEHPDHRHAGLVLRHLPAGGVAHGARDGAGEGVRAAGRGAAEPGGALQAGDEGAKPAGNEIRPGPARGGQAYRLRGEEVLAIHVCHAFSARLLPVASVRGGNGGVG